MKKTALTSIISLKAACPSCTYDQLSALKVWWNVRDVDIHSRKSVNNTYWKSWMLSGKVYNTSMLLRIKKQIKGILV